MKIILSSDEKYLPHAAALIKSIYANTAAEVEINFLYLDLMPESIEKLRRFVVECNGCIKFIPVDISPIAGFPARGHISLSAYLRMLAPLYVESDQAVYLDVDTIVLADISTIMAGIRDDYYVYAVEEPNSEKYRLGFPPGKPYFNSGCMVMNLRLWRRDNLTDKLLARSAQFGWEQTYHDQDTMNYVLDGNFGLLHPRWNVHHAVADRRYWPKFSCYTQEQLEEAISKPGIVHFSFGKPWNYGCEHRFRHYYRQYRSQTPWEYSSPAGFTWEKFFIFYKNQISQMIPESIKRIIRNKKRDE